MKNLVPDLTGLAREIEEFILQADGRAAQEHLATGRLIYCRDLGSPRQIANGGNHEGIC